MSQQNTVNTVIHRKYIVFLKLVFQLNNLINKNGITESGAVGPNPQPMTCPSCNATIVTQMRFESTTKTHIIAGLLCLFM